MTIPTVTIHGNRIYADTPKETGPGGACNAHGDTPGADRLLVTVHGAPNPTLVKRIAATVRDVDAEQWLAEQTASAGLRKPNHMPGYGETYRKDHYNAR